MLPSPMPSHSWLLALPSRRAVLSVPADSLRKVQKAAQLGSRLDTVCLDLEDAVAEEQKEAARRSAFDALAGPLAVSFGRSERALRVNGPESTHFEADMALAARLHRQGALDCLVVPKVDSQALATRVYECCAKERGENGASLPPLPLLAMCESGEGLLRLQDTIDACFALEHKGPGNEGLPLQLQGWIMGADDMAASLGLTRARAPGVADHARVQMAMVARSRYLQAIDQVHIEFKDLDALKEDALKGRGLGMSGKHIIHPAQIDPVQEVFSPDPQLVAGARKIVRNFEEQRGEGAKGAIEVDGKMIDRPTYLQAKQLVHLANELGL